MGHGLFASAVLTCGLFCVCGFRDLARRVRGRSLGSFSLRLMLDWGDGSCFVVAFMSEALGAGRWALGAGVAVGGWDGVVSMRVAGA